jgi:hypothetical protein
VWDEREEGDAGGLELRKADPSLNTREPNPPVGPCDAGAYFSVMKIARTVLSVHSLDEEELSNCEQ